jgi:glycine oxidase
LTSKDKTAIIGGGIIGLSIGWRLLRRGKDVEIYDSAEAGKGASWVSAGMLAPVSEAGFEEMDLLKLNLASIGQYPKFADELREDSDIDIDLRTEGTMMIAVDRDQSERLRRLYEFRKKIDLPVEWMTGSEAREREPELSPVIKSAVWIPNDYQVDNRNLIRALLEAINKIGGRVHEHTPVESVTLSGDTISGISVNGEHKQYQTVVIANGAWARTIQGLPDDIRPPVRPVKGQILTLRITGDFGLKKVIRSPEAYFAPKKDGRLIVGATVEEKGFELHPTAGGVKDILESAWEAIPGIYDLPLEEINVGLRPSSRDNAPILSDTPVKGLYIATGHYRHGILLTPVTAYEMTDLIIQGKASELITPFSLLRFKS